MERGFLELSLLSAVHAGGGTAEAAVASESDLNKDDAVGFLHDEVNLAPSAMVVALDQFESGCEQVL